MIKLGKERKYQIFAIVVLLFIFLLTFVRIENKNSTDRKILEESSNLISKNFESFNKTNNVENKNKLIKESTKSYLSVPSNLNEKEEYKSSEDKIQKMVDEMSSYYNNEFENLKIENIKSYGNSKDKDILNLEIDLLSVNLEILNSELELISFNYEDRASNIDYKEIDLISENIGKLMDEYNEKISKLKKI